MDAIAVLEGRLEKHPNLQWSRGHDWLKIDAPSAERFAVELRQEGGEWNVYLGSGWWHQHFDDPRTP